MALTEGRDWIDVRDPEACWPERKMIPLLDIQRIVAAHFGFTVDQLRGPVRRERLCYARHIAMYLCCRHTERSLPFIGRAFGNRDHTTISHGRDKIENLVVTDPETGAVVAQLQREIRAKQETA